MPLLETRGPKSGICNICGSAGPLTEDHTPPKGYAPAVPVQFSHIAERLSSERRPKFQKAPDGVKYRSLCARCNNELLGAGYDPALIDMASQVTGLLTSSLLLPRAMIVRIKPQRVARAVLGHIAAQGVLRYDKGPSTIPLRDYILDPSLPMLDDIRLCYWVYPHRARVLVRDAVIMRLLNGSEPSAIWMMKCFPLAFAVLWNRDFQFDAPCQPRNFDAHVGAQIDDVADLLVDLSNVPPEYWPEAPTDSTILGYGQEALMATVSPLRGKLLRI